MQRYWSKDVGGKIKARFVRSIKPTNARLLVTHQSAPLHQVIREVNKKSNLPVSQSESSIFFMYIIRLSITH